MWVCGVPCGEDQSDRSGKIVRILLYKLELLPSSYHVVRRTGLDPLAKIQISFNHNYKMSLILSFRIGTKHVFTVRSVKWF